MLSWRLKKDTVLQPFSRDCLFVSVYDSLKHRKTALQDASSLTDTIINQCLEHITHATLSRDDLARVTTKTLQRFDNVAATHYSAFHPVS